MLELVIVEDDPSQADHMRGLVEQSIYADILDVTCISDSVAAHARVADYRRHIDILICALYPGDAGSEVPTGIELVQQLPRHSGTQVVYVTGHDSYHSSVYRTDHAYFLLKPVTQAGMNSALQRCIERIDEQSEEPLRLKTRKAERVIMPNKIAYVESVRRTAVVHAGENSLTVYIKLAELEDALPARFVRCHKSYLVNLEYVAEYRSDRLLLVTGDEIPISQSKRKEVRDAFVRFVRASR